MGYRCMPELHKHHYLMRGVPGPDRGCVHTLGQPCAAAMGPALRPSPLAHLHLQQARPKLWRSVPSLPPCMATQHLLCMGHD